MSDNHNTSINDIIQEKFDYRKLKFFRTLIILGVGGILYTSIGINNFLKVLIVYFILMAVRWVISEITVEKEFDRKRYQISGHLILFVLILIAASNAKIFYMDNEKIFIGLITLYTFINIVTRGTTTANAAFSLLLVYVFSNLKQISDYLRPVITYNQPNYYLPSAPPMYNSNVYNNGGSSY